MTSASDQPTKTHAGTGTLRGSRTTGSPAPRNARGAAAPVWLTVALAIVVVLVASFQVIVQGDFAAAFQLPIVRLSVLAVILTGAGLYAVQHFSLVYDATFRILASAFGVVVAFALALVETSVPLAAEHPVSGVSAVAPWILFLAVVIPRTPIATLVAGLAAAAMWPAAYAINVGARGFSPVPWDHLVVWPGINVLTAVLAALLRRQVRRPRGGSGTSAARARGSYRLSRRSAKAGWARSGGRAIRCSRARRRSSWCGADAGASAGRPTWRQALPPRGQRDRRAAVAAHGLSLRFRQRRRTGASTT